MLNDHFQSIIGRFGRPKGGAGLLRDAELAAYRNIVPPSMLDFWEECGFGLILDGYFQFCNPTANQPLVEQIFEGNKDFDPKLICPIGFSAFGKLLLWHKRYFAIDLDLIDLRMSCARFFRKPARNDPDTVIASVLMGLNENSYDEYDQDGKKLFKRTLKKLGLLKPDHIYGFKPALALGGTRSLDNLTTYDAIVHMSFLSQLGAIKLLDISKLGQTSSP